MSVRNSEKGFADFKASSREDELRGGGISVGADAGGECVLDAVLCRRVWVRAKRQAEGLEQDQTRLERIPVICEEGGEQRNEEESSNWGRPGVVLNWEGTPRR